MTDELIEVKRPSLHLSADEKYNTVLSFQSKDLSHDSVFDNEHQNHFYFTIRTVFIQECLKSLEADIVGLVNPAN
ncbi:hypothetical protein SK128_015957 [Halocaridina rubra]|uniref:Uncharacterized protein n=1 Tax=Halocaridina rubra TaxID=373956 RepID=A0AAN8X8D2_HALRR